MTQIETHSLRIEKTIAAPPAKVRAALTDPALLARWFAPGPMRAVVHACDARIGGQYEISMEGPAHGAEQQVHTCTGTFQELSDARVVMTFNWTGEPLPNDTTLTFEVRPEGKGTRLVLVHEGFPTKEAADMHIEGWEGCLANLPGSL